MKTLGLIHVSMLRVLVDHKIDSIEQKMDKNKNTPRTKRLLEEYDKIDEFLRDMQDSLIEELP